MIGRIRWLGCEGLQDPIGGDEGLLGVLLGDVAAGVGVAVVAGEVAAGDLQADAVTGLEYVECYRQVEPDLVHVLGFEQFGVGK
jgi:hypothetical protein